MKSSTQQRTQKAFVLTTVACLLLVFGFCLTLPMREVSAVSYTPVASYGFDGDATDSLNGSALTFAPVCSPGGSNWCNVSSSYGTDSSGTFWSWTADRGRGGGFLVDTNATVGTTFSVALKISFQETNCFRTIIDSTDGTSDNHLYFCGGIQLYPRPTSTEQFLPNTVYDILISRLPDGTVLIYKLDSNGAAVKVLEVADNPTGQQSLIIPAATTSGGSRFRFFHDECCEYTTGGKVYDIRVWANQVLPPEQFSSAGSVTTTTTSTTTTSTTTTIAPTTTSSTTLAPTTTVGATTSTSPVTGQVVDINIQAPTGTVAMGQASVATVAPKASNIQTPLTIGPKPTTSTSIAPPTPLLKSDSQSSKNAPAITDVDAGEGAVDVGGKTVVQTLTRRNNQLEIRTGELSTTLSSTTADGAIAPLDNDGNLRISSGDTIRIHLEGFKPNSEVSAWFFSTPIKLGTVKVQANGSVTAAFKVPEGVEDGTHRVAVTAQLKDGKSATFTMGVIVGKLQTTSTLTRILIVVPITLAIFVGFLLPNRIRRRKSLRS